LRAAGGANFDFVLSGGGSLSAGDAASVASALERFHLLWFDEPCRLSNLGAVRKIAAEGVTPLGFGTHLHHGGDFQDLLREEVADVLRPSLALNGITQIRRIAAVAETYYIAVAPYHNGGPVGTAAALHLAASLPNFFIQQIPLPEAEADRRMRAEITGTSVEVVTEGYAALPVGAGLGITVREEALEKYKERA
jgi:galactonate dehydratase